MSPAIVIGNSLRFASPFLLTAKHQNLLHSKNLLYMKKISLKWRLLIIPALILLNVSCDQVSKNVARESLNYYDRTEVLGEYLVLTKIENKGAMLSAFSELPDQVRFIMLGVVPAVVLLLGVILLLSQKRVYPMRLLGFCFVIGGGMGNIIDRLLYGSVTDFVILSAGPFRTGIFNMADVSVMLGTGIVLWALMQQRIQERRNLAAETIE